MELETLPRETLEICGDKGVEGFAFTYLGGSPKLSRGTIFRGPYTKDHRFVGYLGVPSFRGTTTWGFQRCYEGLLVRRSMRITSILSDWH